MAMRSARSPRRQEASAIEDEGGLSALVSRHRLTIGGLTAFMVAFSYVGANALWYQPHAHGGAFFPTRPLAGAMPYADPQVDPAAAETIIRLERPEAEPEVAGAGSPVPVPAPQGPAAVATTPPSVPAPPPVAGDPVVKEVQRTLAGLNLYDGTVDGLSGPRTRGAIEAYRKMVGLAASGEIDDDLLKQLGVGALAAESQPLPHSPGTDMIATSSAVREGDPMVMRIQAGLKAFGNDGIELDGIVGSKTRSAIVEFQSLFGLPATGEPDETLYAKMREIGLTD